MLGASNTPQALTDLLMRQKLAALQSCLTPSDSFHETIFLLKVTRDNTAHKLIRLDAVLFRSLHEPCLHIRCKSNFHSLKPYAKIAR